MIGSSLVSTHASGNDHRKDKRNGYNANMLKSQKTGNPKRGTIIQGVN
jgi:hypothetical protein